MPGDEEVSGDLSYTWHTLDWIGFTMMGYVCCIWGRLTHLQPQGKQLHHPRTGPVAQCGEMVQFCFVGSQGWGKRLLRFAVLEFSKVHCPNSQKLCQSIRPVHWNSFVERSSCMDTYSLKSPICCRREPVIQSSFFFFN